MLNPTEQEVLDLITERASHYQDRVVNGLTLNPIVSSNPDQVLTFNEVGHEYATFPTNSAVSQYLNHLKIPIIFFKRCSSDLKQRILNEHKKDKDFLIRGLDENICRAVLTSHYSRDKDDIHVIPPALEGLRADSTELSEFTYDSDFTHLTARFNDCRVAQGDSELVASVSVVNSETGHSSIWIYPTVTVNGYTYANKRGDISNNLHRIIHRGEFKVEEFRQIVQDTKNLAQIGIVQYLRAQNETVTGEHAAEFVKTIEDFPNRFAQLLENDWKERQAIVKVDAMNQIVRMAQELPLFQKISVSRQVGRFIKLFENSQRDRVELLEFIEN